MMVLFYEYLGSSSIKSCTSEKNHLRLSFNPFNGLNPGLDTLSFLSSPLPTALIVELTFSILSDKIS